jgi:hypothetical protein
VTGKSGWKGSTNGLGRKMLKEPCQNSVIHLGYYSEKFGKKSPYNLLLFSGSKPREKTSNWTSPAIHKRVGKKSRDHHRTTLTDKMGKTQGELNRYLQRTIRTTIW